ncbi:hypothetical protein BASA81_018508 [Batrachochytrium salamandrivorans]|nr:hypothetical protein BASA81_018508 [Batrachochytrium salamandrivorans]
MKKDLKDISLDARMPLNRSASRTHAPSIRPVPPVALPFERWGIDSMDQWWKQEWHEFERENSIRHLATTPYHPQTNGMVERMHAMLGHGLTTLVADKRDRWDEYLPQVLLAIRLELMLLLDSRHSTYSLEHTLDFQRRNTPRSSLMPLDELKVEENSEFIARNLEKLARHDQQQMSGPKAQAEAMRKRNGFDENSDYYFQSWRYGEDETP